MADAELARVPDLPEPERRPMPDLVDVDVGAGLPPHSAKETSMLREMTGRGFSELAGEEADEGDRERVIVWFTLRRMGYEPTWDEAGEVLINYLTPDPTSAGASVASPPSVTSGE